MELLGPVPRDLLAENLHHRFVLSKGQVLEHPRQIRAAVDEITGRGPTLGPRPTVEEAVDLGFHAAQGQLEPSEVRSPFRELLNWTASGKTRDSSR